MLDLTLLRVLKIKENYDKVVPQLPSDAFEQETMVMIKDFGKYLKETGATRVEPGPFKSFFFNIYHPKMAKDRKDYFNRLIDNIGQDVDPGTIRAMTNRLIELGFATDVGNKAADYHKGDELDIIFEVGVLHEKAKNSIDHSDVDKLFISEDIGEILDADKKEDGLRFRIGVLRDGLRPLRTGDFVIAAGRPDTGKTSFISSEVTYMVQQTKKPILWFNNEGEGNRIVKRIYQSALNSTIEELVQKKHAGTLEKEYAAAMAGNSIRVIDCHDWFNSDVEEVVAATKPGLVIFDMIDNIQFRGAKRDSRTDQVLENMYQWARKLGVKHGFPIIATSQVSADAEREENSACYPSMHMLKDSKTGKQGAADLIIMIGRSNDPLLRNARYISTPKNKLARKQAYLQQQVNFDITRARYFDPIKQ